VTKYQRYHANRRARLLRRLGGFCAHCGTNETLQIAHLHGDGGDERAKRGSAGVITDLLSRSDEELHTYVALLCSRCHRAHDLAAGHLAWKGERQYA
jgi:hypothetical protein